MLIGGAIFGARVLVRAAVKQTHLEREKSLGRFVGGRGGRGGGNWTEEKETNATSSSSIKLEKRAEKELEETRKSLNQKIAELNKAIDEFSDEADVRLNAKLGRLSEELDSAEARSF